ncbi:MAG: hypothetical protein Q9168_004697 [Polycauliona sp. 1 TL-2023]
MEPLSVTASVIAVLQAAEAVISVCCNYRSASAGSSWEVPRVLEGTRDLRNVLRTLEDIADKAETGAKGGKSNLPALAKLCDPTTGSLVQCLETLSSLEKRLTPPSWFGPDGSKRSNLVQALSWPLKKAETERTLEKLEGFKSTLNLAVSLDQTSIVMALRDTTLESKATARRKDILAWLNAPDPTSKYSNGLKARHTGTGSWYVDSDAFDRWKKEVNSISWLWGIPGCGKTVLSTTIIEKLTDLCSRNQDHALAYFYFAFDDQALQNVEGMIRSLIAQLCSQRMPLPDCVDSLYTGCVEEKSQATSPTYDILQNMLHQILGCFDHTFIVLDALDECTERHELITVLEGIADLRRPELHLLTTSRKELDLQECMESMTKEADRIAIQGTAVADDISSYVSGRLGTDRRLKRWHTTEQEKIIVSTLTSKAHGISISELHKALQALPKDLDDTYARILNTIDDEGNYAQVSKILQLLVGSNEPVTLDVAAEIITIELDQTPQIDLERRLVDPADVLSICSTLVILDTQERPRHTGMPVLRLAHFSVSEYLLSTRVQGSTLSHWHMDDVSSHVFIARLFIAYILFLESNLERYTGDGGLSRQVFYLDYPLADAAISTWHKHLSIAENNDADPVSGATGSQLFINHSGGPRSRQLKLPQVGYCRCCVSELSWWKPTARCKWDSFGIKDGSLIFAAHHNLPQTTKFLLKLGANPNTPVYAGYARPRDPFLWDTPLAKASYLGHVSVAKQLLAHQAEVDLEHKDCPNALKRACRIGNTEVVRLLLDHGADPNARSPTLVTALGEAMLEGDFNSFYGGKDSDFIKTMVILLEAGANIAENHQPTTGPYQVAPVVFAIERGFKACAVEVLLDYGANAVDALVVSCIRGSPEKALLCLAYVDDVNARAPISQDRDDRSWAGCTALERACTKDNPTIVRLLLDRGADPNLCSPQTESALEAYLNRPIDDLECEHAPIFVLLLKHGADWALVREDKLKGDDDMGNPKIPIRSKNGCRPSDLDGNTKCNGKAKYRAVLERWETWKADDSLSPIDVIGSYRHECTATCQYAVE